MTIQSAFDRILFLMRSDGVSDLLQEKNTSKAFVSPNKHNTTQFSNAEEYEQESITPSADWLKNIFEAYAYILSEREHLYRCILTKKIKLIQLNLLMREYPIPFGIN